MPRGGPGIKRGPYRVKSLYGPVSGYQKRSAGNPYAVRGGPADPARAAKIAEQYHAGRAMEDIGAEFGLTRQRILQILIASGEWTRHNFVLTEREFQIIETQWPDKSIPVEQIVAQLDVKKVWRARQIASELGIKRGWGERGPSKRTLERLAKIRELRAEGLTYTNIAKALGLRKTEVRGVVDRLGRDLLIYPNRHRSIITPEMRERIREAIRKGDKSQAQIGEEFGVAQVTVSGISRKMKA